MTSRKKQTRAARQRTEAQDSFLDQPDDSIGLPARVSLRCYRLRAAGSGEVLNSTDWTGGRLESTNDRARQRPDRQVWVGVG